MGAWQGPTSWLFSGGDHRLSSMRRGGRVVDRVALEMRSTRKRTGGSNPSLSANYRSPMFAGERKGSKNYLYIRISHDLNSTVIVGDCLEPHPRLGLGLG